MGELLLRFKTEHPELMDHSITYAGRLDPMAEGIVILLAGEMVHKKDDFLSFDKTYEFEVLWGIETDTQDILGLVTKANLSSGRIDTKDYVGKHIQKYPAYSSRKVEGKPMFQWAREGKLAEIIIPEHNIEIYSLDILSERKISGLDLLKDIEHSIAKVHGDFRQKEIVELWQETLRPLSGKEFFITKMRAHVSSGTYIRTLAGEMGGLAYSIVRTRVGN